GVGHRLRHKEINSYSNLSWFLEAKQGHYFKGGKLHSFKDPEIRFEECTCETCGGMMPQELIDLMLSDKELGLKTLALHNLLDMNGALKRGR
ncbi:MAG: hypothetical protein QXV57_05865, partial [Thermoproteota archaeon]